MMSGLFHKQRGVATVGARLGGGVAVALALVALALSGCPSPSQDGSPGEQPEEGPPQYRIVFDTQGGKPEIEPVIRNVGVRIKKPVDPFLDDAHRFSGWYSEPEGKGVLYLWPHIIEADTTMYVYWKEKNPVGGGAAAPEYTVTFDTQGGEAVEPVVAAKGTELSAPAPAKEGYIFDGWFSAPSGGSRYAWPHELKKDLTMYAQWKEADLPEGLSLERSLAWIRANAVEGGKYTVAVSADETLKAQDLSFKGRAVEIALDGGDAEKRVSLKGTGALFTVDSKVRLTLGKNITLVGAAGNTDALVRVNEYGTLIMEETATLTGNTSNGRGGAAYIEGAFEMNGGSITHNTAAAGGAVYVYGGSFTVRSGVISDNTATAYGGAVFVDHIRIQGSGSPDTYRGEFIMENGLLQGNTAANYGGGVYVSYGAFTMRGGELRGNTLTSGGGGGVYVAAGTFTLEGGIIAQNQANNGGGVYLTHEKARFIMRGGTIGGAAGEANTAAANGGGVYVAGGAFEMNGGEMSRNTGNNGGGVYVTGGAFTLNSGEIARNTGGNGGGVYINGSGSTFTMSGGTIAENAATNDGGGGVYVCQNGAFEMSGGTITENTSGNYGGGVFFNRNTGSTFTMSGGTITKNTADNNGGGVIMKDSGAFEMSGGAAVTGKISALAGGGVYITNSTFTMSGGAAVTGNTSDLIGGGVYVIGGAFTMSGGAVSGNKADVGSSSYGAALGGGVYLYSGTFEMSGGEMSGNKAAASSSSAQGGGVYVVGSASFKKTNGGTIYGSDAPDAALRNTVSTTGMAAGHAVYVSASKKRDTTADASVNLDSAVPGAPWE
jgi:uncharacterized repeat protein (TIGR02543 family)